MKVTVSSLSFLLQVKARTLRQAVPSLSSVKFNIQYPWTIITIQQP